MNREELIALRREKDQFFKASPQSPLSLDQQDTFTGLSYYEPNAALDLVVTVEPVSSADNEIMIETTTGDTRHYRRYGRFRFNAEGQDAELTIYEAPHGYFLPFVDASAGVETYIAGRYLEPDELDDGAFHVDFNLAYNPYCAYGDGWSCPITPAENRLNVAIRAGEKNPVGPWVAPLSPLDPSTG
jgi:uncharacterized protein (DUF1684 family)